MNPGLGAGLGVWWFFFSRSLRIYPCFFITSRWRKTGLGVLGSWGWASIVLHFCFYSPSSRFVMFYLIDPFQLLYIPYTPMISVGSSLIGSEVTTG